MTQLLTALLTDILLAAEDVPVTIRLLDVARHELVDDSVDDTGPVATITELNPMMGTRGVRDFLVNADLGVAQVIAIGRSRRAVAESRGTFQNGISTEEIIALGLRAGLEPAAE